MFYSETLLSKTGPLARVWLAANIERKLTKKDVLSSGIERSVHAIVDQGQAPMALRLSGQLLLGVVRIYSRKARYLLDDCNEALLKIKMAFRPGNVDLPVEQARGGTAAALTLPDVLTELDLMAPMPDPEFLLADFDTKPSGKAIQDPTLLDWGSSQLLTESLSINLAEPLALEDDDLGLDITDIPADSTIMSIEQGRRAPSIARGLDDDLVLPEEPSKLYDDDLDLDLGQEMMPSIEEDDMTMLAPPPESDLPMLVDVPTSPQSMEAPTPAPMEEAPRVRDSVSPLSSVGSVDERELTDIFPTLVGQAAEAEAEPVKPTHRVKRRRILQADTTTELSTHDIRARQNDRSGILRPTSFLPRDPLMMNLVQTHRHGSFAAAVLGQGRTSSWAPELRDLFSIDALRQTGEAKRKRVSDVSMVEDVPGLILDEDETMMPLGGDRFASEGVDPSELLVDVPASAGNVEPEQPSEAGIGHSGLGELDVPPLDLSDDEPLTPVGEFDDGISSFDDTAAPLLYPAESGPVSVATKRVVHELRDWFGEYTTPELGSEPKTISFVELAPAPDATKVEATKMFFEMLVLATKDAIKVDQKSNSVGEPIRIRAKRGLWGAWAEESPTGLVDQEEEDKAAAKGQKEPVLSSMSRVSVVPSSPQQTQHAIVA